MIADERRYQVFISSTFTDLQKERTEVLQAVLEMRAFPAGMELFPSANDEQWSFIKREIESSDYYIVIVAGKYGSVREDGISFTEQEYDYAVQLKKPVMGFLFHDLGALRGSQLELDQGRAAKLDSFRAKVARGRLVKFFHSPDELKSQIWQALTHAFQVSPQEGWTRARNSRRLEDLEEVSNLQKRVLQLERELAIVGDDGTDSLAQGADEVSWMLGLQTSYTSSGLPIRPPADRYVFLTTWSELLATIFENRLSEVTASEGINAVRLSLVDRLKELTDALHPSWGMSILPDTKASFLVFDDWEKMILDIRKQFFAVGYITITGTVDDGLSYSRVPIKVRDDSGTYVDATQTFRPYVNYVDRYEKEIWQLTKKGRLQLARATAMKREPTILSLPMTGADEHEQ